MPTHPTGLLSLPARSSLIADAYPSPIRCIGFATGYMRGPGNGLHGSRCTDEHRRACLLPHDEESVRADGNAGIAWLLPKGPAGRSHQCA